MKLPYTPVNVLHRHGGKILEITGIKHQVDKPRDGRSMDSWWFVGRVKWEDGSGSEAKESPIDVPMLCSDTESGMDEIRGLSDLMMDYLKTHGEWHEHGKHEGWYAHRKERSPA